MISVSIVEDHDFYRLSLVKMMAGSERLQVLDVYASAEEAILRMPLNMPDVAVVDIKLKGMSGIDLVRSLRVVMPKTQFLMCTAFQDDESVFNALRAGASGYIVKDAAPEDIVNAIVDLHHGGAPMSPYIARKVISVMQEKPAADPNELSARELEVITLLSKGLLYKEISDTLSISINTVKNHLKNIYKKLHVQNKVEALNKYKLK